MGGTICANTAPRVGRGAVREGEECVKIGPSQERGVSEESPKKEEERTGGARDGGDSTGTVLQQVSFLFLLFFPSASTRDIISQRVFLIERDK